MAGRFSIETVFKSVDRISRPVRRMQTRVGRFTKSIERGFRRARRVVGRFTSSIIATGRNLAMIGTSIAAVGAFALVHFNRATSEVDALASSVGVSTGLIKALGNEIESAGFNYENIVDLVEEMNNKLGESSGLEELTPVTESLKVLGLEFKNIRKLAPEEQFKAIMDAALGMADAQQASAAVDILMGGEANRIIGLLRQRGSSIREVTERQRLMNFMSDGATKGAVRFTRAFRDSGRMVKSIGSRISGLVGERIAPLIEHMNTWIVVNKKLINQKIDEWIGKAATAFGEFVTRVDDWLKTSPDVIGMFSDFVTKLTDVVDVLKWVGIGVGSLLALNAALWAFETVMVVVNAVLLANPVGLMVAAVALLVIGVGWLIWKWEEFKDVITSVVDYAMGKLDALKEMIADVINGFVQMATFGILGGDRVAPAKHMQPTLPAIMGPLTVDQEYARLRSLSDARVGMSMSMLPNPPSVAGQNNTVSGEITIKDETGRAEVTEDNSAPGVKLSVENTGGM